MKDCETLLALFLESELEFSFIILKKERFTQQLYIKVNRDIIN